MNQTRERVRNAHLCFLQSNQNQNASREHINSELIERYLAWKKTQRPSAAITYRLWVTRFQQFVNKDPEDLEIDDFVAFSESIQGKYAEGTIRNAHLIVHNYLKFYSDEGKLGFSIRLVTIPEAESNSRRVVTEEEVRKMLNSMTRNSPLEMRDELIVRILHNTGMRLAELTTINIDDINDTQSVIITTKKNKRKKKRIVFWTNETDDLMRQYLEWRKQQSFETNALFVALGRGGDLGWRISRQTVELVIKRVCRNANLSKSICPHSFRHAFIHRMARKCIPDSIIIRLTGHSTPAMISDYTVLSRPETEMFFMMGNGQEVPGMHGSAWNDVMSAII